MTAPVFAYPILPNHGLGNRLFTWARCKVYSERNQIPMLTPTWTQFKLGPMLRRERDWRWYSGEFQPVPGEISGFQKRWLLWTQPHQPEPESLEKASAQNGIHVFTGWADFFERLNGHHALLRKALEAACHPQWMSRVNALPPAPIALHVRRGDFKNERGDFVTSLSWFEGVVKRIREASAQPIQVFSDGRDEEIAPLLRVPNIQRVSTGSACGDLLAMARARLLVASGGSTFSAWAAFLGQMPTFTPPGHPLSFLKLKPPPGMPGGEFDPNITPTPEFVETLKRCG